MPGKYNPSQLHPQQAAALNTDRLLGEERFEQDFEKFDKGWSGFLACQFLEFLSFLSLRDRQFQVQEVPSDLNS